MKDMNVRRPLIAGNWKLYKTPADAVVFINKLKLSLPPDLKVDITVAPAFPALDAAVRAAAGSPVTVAAQNVFWEAEGAFTGEVSTGMLTALQVTQVIIGHSERRQYFNETDQTVNRRIKAALNSGLTVILCVGETLEQREAGQTFKTLETQIKVGLADVTAEQYPGLIIAYEPVWAIGTGKTATPEIAQEAHQFIRNQLEKGLANSMRILYGGSVKPDNAATLMAKPDIDGALVGGASLKPDVFFNIINYE